MYVRKRHPAYPPDMIRGKRQNKNKRFSDVIFSSSLFQYFQIILTWGVIVAIDMIQDVRLEYTWPCWLLIRSSHDTYKCHGLWFTIFFLILAIFSDVLVYLSLPLPLLLLIGSFLVWLRLIFNAERGICIPNILLCILFLYVEIFVRSRDHRKLNPLMRQIMKPLASHCVGYPVVTLCFQVKSQLMERFTERNRTRVRESNQFYFDLLEQALPEESRSSSVALTLVNGRTNVNGYLYGPAGDEEYLERGIESLMTPTTNSSAALQTSSPTKSSKNPKERHPASSANNCCPNGKTTSSQDGSTFESQLHLTSTKESLKDTSPLYLSTSSQNSSSQTAVPTCTVTPQMSHSSSSTSLTSSVQASKNKNKEDSFSSLSKLEADNRRLKSELQTSKATENELRSQIQHHTAQERTHNTDTQRLKQEIDSLLSRTQSLNSRLQEEKNKVQASEKRLQEERRSKQTLESQLEKEKKLHKENVEAARQAAQQAALQVANAKNECNEACKARRREMEAEMKQLRRDYHSKEERVSQLEMELEKIRMVINENRELVAQRDALRDEQKHVIEKLREENRFKQDLLTAYHEAQSNKEKLEVQMNQLENELMQAHSLLNGFFSNSNVHCPLSLSPSLQSNSSLYGHSMFNGVSSSHLLQPSIHHYNINPRCASASPSPITASASSLSGLFGASTTLPSCTSPTASSITESMGGGI